MLGIARALLMGAGAGLGWMYFLDPQSGKRRRALIRDQGAAAIRQASCWLDKAFRDTEHRMQGSIAEARGIFDFSIPSDQQLIERVRARLGHIASHPRLIDVHAENGRVTLDGHAPAEEIDCIASCASRVRGVRSVDNRLDDELGPDVSNDGQRRRQPRPPIDLMRENWAPSTRLVVGTLGTALMLNCLARRTPGAILMGTLGCGLFFRATGNRDLGKLVEGSTNLARPIMDRMHFRDGHHATEAPMTFTKQPAM
jgi:hypothetical protein